MDWSNILVQRLMANPKMAKIYVIPGSLFFLDFALRTALGAGVMDAGADMAFLAVVTFVTILIESFDHSRTYIYVPVFFIILFIIPWVVCLKIVSLQNPILPALLNIIDVRIPLCWLIGLVSFVLSGRIANVIIIQTVSKTE